MIRLALIGLLLALSVNLAAAQTRSIATPAAQLRYDSIPANRIWLNKGWIYHPGDNAAWASPNWDDQSWESIDPTKPLQELTQVSRQGIGWLRLHLQVGDKLRQQPLALTTHQFCALEIYLNGRLLNRQGLISTQANGVKAYTGFNAEPVRVVFDGQTDQVLAIRFAPWPHWKLFNQQAIPYLVQASLSDLSRPKPLVVDQQDESMLNGMGIGICLLLIVLHTAFFGYNPAQWANLYFALYALTLTAFFSIQYGFTSYRFERVDEFVGGTIVFNVVIQMMFIWPLRALYSLFNRKPSSLYYGLWLVLPFTLVLLFAPLFPPSQTWLYLIISVTPMLLALVEQLRLIWQAVRAQKRGAYIIASGFGVALLFIIGRILLSSLSILPASISTLFLFSVTLAPVLGISLYLAREFALDSQLLQLKLLQVQQLSAQTLAQEQEKQHLLAVQNETLEQQVSERTVQLRQSLDSLKATQAQLIQKEKMASLGNLTAGIAHEIQNPLNFVNNFSEVSTELVDELTDELDKGDTDEAIAIAGDLRQNLQKITQHGGRASAIVRGMLEHSRTETGEKRPTNLNALADEYLKIAYQGFRAKNKDFHADLKMNFESKVNLIEVVPQEIGRVLLNLYNNAFYAVQQRDKGKGHEEPYQPTVRVSTHQLNGQTEIRVSDNGTGIPESVKAKIFQPFFTTKPTGEGTGLGLSLSYDIITKGHGGSLTVESQEGEGTQFVLQLPALS